MSMSPMGKPLPSELHSDLSASREKYWSELTDQEKIERMRKIVKQGQREQQELRNFIEALLGHAHALDGSLMRKFDVHPPGYGTSARSDQGNDVYF